MEEDATANDGERELFVLQNGADAVGIIVEFFLGFFDGGFAIFDDVDFGEEFDAPSDDFRDDSREESGADDGDGENGVEHEAEIAGAEEADGKIVTEDDERENCDDEEADLGGNHTNNRDGGVITLFEAAFVHVVNLERLPTDGGRGDVVVIAAKKNDTGGGAPVF